MVRRILSSVVLSVLFFIMSCVNPSSTENSNTPPIVESSPVLADSYEPDNTQATTKSFKPDSLSQSRTLKKGDIDWVSFSALSGKSYTVVTSGTTDTKIKVYSSNGSTLIAEGDDSPGSFNAMVQFSCTSTGTFYVSITGNDESVSGAYGLTVVTSMGLDSYEPDASPLFASSVSTATSQSRTLVAGDVDWVSCYIVTGDTILLTAKGTVLTSITLYDRDTTTSLAVSPVTDSIAQIRYRASASGTYFFKIKAQNSSANGLYLLTLQASKNGTLVTTDLYENDNSRLSAKFISGNSIIQQRSLTVSDTDWVILPLAAGRQYTLTSSNASVLATMYAKDGTALQGPLASLFINSSATDTVYVKITSSSPTFDYNYLLMLNVLLSPSMADDFELDNTKAQAKAKCFTSDSLIQDRTITFNNSISDTDWVAFPVFAGKQYVFKVSTLSSTALYMHLHNKTSSSSLQYSSGNSLSYTAAVSDTMYLQMFRQSGSTAVAYTLTVSGQFVNDTYEPDSSRLTARTLSTSLQNRILLPKDTDWVMYTVAPGDSISILTTGITDTKIALFSSSGSTPLTENDDIGSDNTNAMISWKSVYGGQFFIRITGKTPAVSGSYTLQALSVKGGTLVAEDSLENDNSKAKARIISDSIVAGEVHSLTMNDTDWVALPVVVGGQYTVTASNTLTYLSLYAYNSKDSVLDFRTSATAPSIRYTAPKNDTLYFRVSSPSIVSKYTLSVSRITPPGPDSYENDNTKANAYKASGSFSSQSRTITAGDTDWVSIPVLVGGKYALSALSLSGQIVLYNSAGYQMSATSGSTMSITATATDTFFYQITGLLNYSTSRYTLSLTVTPPSILSDSYENDNKINNAKKLLIDSTVQGRTITLNDTDFVYFIAKAGDNVKIQTTQTAVSYISLNLYDSLGSFLISNSSTSYGTALSYTILRSGTYHCRIVSLSSSNFAYKLMATVGKIDTLTIGTTSSRNLMPSDTQWVAVVLDSNQAYSMKTTGTATDTRMWLYDTFNANSYLMYNDNGSGINAYFIYTPKIKGLYYLKIVGQSSSTSGNYGLIVSTL